MEWVVVAMQCNPLCFETDFWPHLHLADLGSTERQFHGHIGFGLNHNHRISSPWPNGLSSQSHACVTWANGGFIRWLASSTDDSWDLLLYFSLPCRGGMPSDCGPWVSSDVISSSSNAQHLLLPLKKGTLSSLLFCCKWAVSRLSRTGERALATDRAVYSTTSLTVPLWSMRGANYSIKMSIGINGRTENTNTMITNDCSAFLSDKISTSYLKRNM